VRKIGTTKKPGGNSVFLGANGGEALFSMCNSALLGPAHPLSS
jgi:hypothetical protein